MNPPYMRRLRRLLLLFAAASRAAARGGGVPLARAIQLSGARSEKELYDDVKSILDLWPAGWGEEAIGLTVEDGEVHLVYAQGLASSPGFSVAEGAVLVAALAPFEEGGGKPVKDAVRKLRRAIPEPLRDEAAQLERGLDVAPAPPEPLAGTLRDAIEQRLEVVVEYRAVNDGAAEARTVEPRLLMHRDGRWYLAAWNVAKQAEHLYRLDRILAARVGTRRFGEHKGPPAARYARRNLYFESGAEREVTLRFTGFAARLARQRYARVREEAGGAVVATTKVTPGNYLLGVVLGHGGEATVDGPPDVVEQLRGRVEELKRLYA